MGDRKSANLNEGQLLAILQSAYQKGEKSIIDNPREMIDELILQMRSFGVKFYNEKA